MKTTNELENLLLNKFPTYGDYEDFVLEFESDICTSKYTRSKQVLIPYGKNTWVTCRIVHKQELPSTAIELPDNVHLDVPVTMLVSAIQTKFTGDLFKSSANPDEPIVTKGELLIVSPAGCVPVPGYNGVVMVNIANVMAGIAPEHIDSWYYERLKSE